MKEYRNRISLKTLFYIFMDIFVIAISSGIGLLLRFDIKLKNVPANYLDSIWNYMAFYIIATIIIFYVFKLYHTLWIYAGINELINITVACVVTSLVQVAGMELMLYDIPRSYYFLSGVVLYLLTLITRFSSRLLFQISKNLDYNNESHQSESKLTNIMIIGGGEASNLLIKEIKNSSHISNVVVKCVIDDSYDKIGQYIHGVKIVGNRDTILYNAKRHKIDEIVIAIPSVSKRTIREIVTICNETDCKLKILPGIYQLVMGEVMVNQLREVRVEDLLGRDIVKVDLDSIMSYVKNKVILITGGGGSIGSELCRQIASHKPKRLIIVDIYENNAYEIQQELNNDFPKLDLVVLIASVRNEDRIDHIFQTYKPDIVYHAAAHKHVPLMEDSPNEAIKNNVVGTWNTVRAADRHGVKKFVLISSDKAVNPTNIMGASKRICEMIIQTYNKRSDTEFVAVRFGNVLGSSGSVIPLFEKQIRAGGPVRVTHPDIIRYFMTIPEAVSLVLQAGAYARGGEIFVLDMGEPVKIADLAKNMIRLSGYLPNEDIMIEYTGLRPGEKLYEELLMDEEGIQGTANNLIYIGKPIKLDEFKFMRQLNELSGVCYEEPKDIRALVKEMVPTYNYKE